MGLNRSRSDPMDMYPRRTFSGTMSTISEHVDWDESPSAPHLEMPNFEPHLDTGGFLADRSAVHHSLHAL